MKSFDEIKRFLNAVGFVGERRALSLGALGFYSFLFCFLGYLLRSAPDIPPEARALAPTLLGLGACYALGFYAVASGWFWGRWFGLGLGQSGVTMAVWVTIMARTLLPGMLTFGLLHAAIVACLAGERMAAAYEGREDWRKRFQIDDQGVVRLRRSVTRAATSLPGLIVLALKPKEDAGSLLLTAAALVGVAGFCGVVRSRAWGVLALGTGGLGVLALGLGGSSWMALSVPHALTASTMPGWLALGTPSVALFAGALLVAAFAPFARPVARFLRTAR